MGSVLRKPFLDFWLTNPGNIGYRSNLTMKSHPTVAKKLSAIALSKQSSVFLVKGSTTTQHRLNKGGELYYDPFSDRDCQIHKPLLSGYIG